MKLFKQILKAVLATILICCGGVYIFIITKIKPETSRLTVNVEKISTPFYWLGAQTDNSFDSLGTMIVPVYLKNCPIKLYMQFDMGHPTTELYKLSLDEINKKFHNIPYQNKDNFFYSFKFLLNSSEITADKIEILNGGYTNINWSDSTSIILIGTIGSDIIENKVLTIDYPTKTISIEESISTDDAKKNDFKSFKFKYRRILLPAIINNEEKDIYFDTGSSMFELITDKEDWLTLSKKTSPIRTYKINSWGKLLTVHSISTDKTIQFNSTILPIKTVTYFDYPFPLIKFAYKLIGVGGMTGNKLFIKNKIIIDTKNLKFAIK